MVQLWWTWKCVYRAHLESSLQMKAHFQPRRVLFNVHGAKPKSYIKSVQRAIVVSVPMWFTQITPDNVSAQKVSTFPNSSLCLTKYLITDVPPLYNSCKMDLKWNGLHWRLLWQNWYFWLHHNTLHLLFCAGPVLRYWCESERARGKRNGTVWFFNQSWDVRGVYRPRCELHAYTWSKMAEHNQTDITVMLLPSLNTLD